MAGTGGDWAAQTADTIERVVGSVRGKTSEPVERVARIVVYGLVAGVVGAVALILLIIGLVRMADAYLPGEVWIPYLVVGGIFTLVGLFLWRKRSVKTVKV
ncbi:MAG: hypothetical protein JWN67_2132 [Actinomycetia bacterium]|nr:hypothetical protein [Actinomycetes bacterium]